MYNKAARLTACTTSAAVAIANQMTPSRTSNVSVDKKHHSNKKHYPLPVPKEGAQARKNRHLSGEGLASQQAW
jgi:hypothetical protein